MDSISNPRTMIQLYQILRQYYENVGIPPNPDTHCMYMCTAMKILHERGDLTEYEYYLLRTDLHYNRPSPFLHKAHYKEALDGDVVWFRTDKLGYYQRIAFLNDVILYHIRNLKPKQ